MSSIKSGQSLPAGRPCCYACLAASSGCLDKQHAIPFNLLDADREEKSNTSASRLGNIRLGSSHPLDEWSRTRPGFLFVPDEGRASGGWLDSDYPCSGLAPLPYSYLAILSMKILKLQNALLNIYVGIDVMRLSPILGWYFQHYALQ